MPTRPAITEPALLAHVFLAADGPSAGAGESLRLLWDGVTKIGVDRAIARVPERLQPATTGGFTERLTLLGGRRAADDSGQFIVYQDHDVLGATLLLAPDTPGTTWADLERQWTTVLGDTSEATGALGSVLVYLGQVADERPGSATIRQLRPLLSSADDASPGTSAFHRGIRLWELAPAGPGPVARHRRLVAVAPPSEKDTLDRWLWSDDKPGLVPLTRYLLHTAKLRYQQEVLVRDLPAVRAAIAEARARCDALSAEIQRPMPPDRLRSTSDLLTQAQSRERGLVDSLSRVRTMAGTVRTAERNMRAALDEPSLDEPGSPLDNDRHIAAWMTDQLATEEIYLQATNDRVSQVTGLAAAAVERVQKARQEALVLLQASLLGGLVTVLAAIQSLEYKLPIRPSLNAPLIATVTAIAVWLPTAILHWPPGSRPGRAWRLLDGLLLGGLAAAVTWLTTGIVGVITNDAPPSWRWTLPIAAGAALCAATVPSLTRLTRRRKTVADQSGS
ncbi:CATRA conflict system CASPASE/TPR repeat-associated protein [Actinoplanes sp. CA-054009]